MSSEVWDQVLDAVSDLCRSHADIARFCTFPGDIVSQDLTAYDIPAAHLFATDTKLVSHTCAHICDLLIKAAPLAKWRETYKDTDIGQDFMDRFACYNLIGEGGPFMSDQLWAWMVYMPAGLHYTWHHHPGEELYVVLAGEAEFLVQGANGVTLKEGETSFHASNQPHAMETHAHPVLALVLWRNGFGIAPVLTPAS